MTINAMVICGPIPVFRGIRASICPRKTARNPNEGFRKILVEIASDPGMKLRVCCRPGYKPNRIAGPGDDGAWVDSSGAGLAG